MTSSHLKMIFCEWTTKLLRFLSECFRQSSVSLVEANRGCNVIFLLCFSFPLIEWDSSWKQFQVCLEKFYHRLLRYLSPSQRKTVTILWKNHSNISQKIITKQFLGFEIWCFMKWKNQNNRIKNLSKQAMKAIQLGNNYKFRESYLPTFLYKNITNRQWDDSRAFFAATQVRQLFFRLLLHFRSCYSA